MPSETSDRNLLVGIIALQMDFVRREQLIAAMHAWMMAKQTPLESIFEQQGALDRPTRELLEALVRKHLALHDNDPEKSLQSLSSVGSVEDELRSIADVDVTHSLHHVGRHGDPLATRPQAIGSLTSAGQRFRILRPHARGGLGEVHVALDTELNREVALKEIQSPHADHPESRARFTLEAEITGGLEHPGVVPVYGLGAYADGRPYYAMRFIRGDSLKDAIDRYFQTEWSGNEGEQSVALRKLLARFLDVCNAMEYAHSRGVLHRDLKPGNIMLGKYGETLVVDWGLAKSIASVDHPLSPKNNFDESQTADNERPLIPASGSGSTPTQMGSALGTPAYMSPEQAAGRLDELGPTSDVYSLGATLYHVLTGRAPFVGFRDVGTLLRQVQKGEFPPPRQIIPTLPRALEAICLKAMSRKPHDRYPSPARLAEDIEHWLADEPVSAASETLAERSARFVRKHKAGAMATAAALCIVACVASVAAILIHREKNENVQLAAANLQLAQNAHRQLAESLYQQANSLWLGGRVGWRQQALDALAKSAKIRPDERLRDLGIQTLLTGDLSQMASMNFAESIEQATLRPDGKQAAVVVGGQLRFWDFDGDKRAISTAQTEPLGDISILCYGPDGRRLFVGMRQGRSIVIDPSTRRAVWSHSFQTSTEPGAALGPGQNQLTWSNGQRIEVWDWSQDNLVAEVELAGSAAPAPVPSGGEQVPAAPAPPPPASPPGDAAWQFKSHLRPFEVLDTNGLASLLRGAVLYRALGAPAEPSLATTPWQPSKNGAPSKRLSTPAGLRPPGRTVVATGQRTPWIAVAREHDAIYVTKLAGAQLETPTVIDGVLSQENICLALTSDEQYLIVAQNEPYRILGPEGLPPSDTHAAPQIEAPTSAPPPPAGPAKEPTPESSLKTGALGPIQWQRTAGANRQSAESKSLLARLFYSMMPMALFESEDNAPAIPERMPAPIPGRLQDLLESGGAKPAVRAPGEGAVPPLPGAVDLPGAQKTNDATSKPPAISPEQPRTPTRASAAESSGAGSGPTRPTIISSIRLSEPTEIESIELGLGSAVSLSTCNGSGMLFAAGRARAAAFLRCEGGRLGLDSMWRPVERELSAAATDDDGRHFITVESNRLAAWQRQGLDYALQLNAPSNAWCQCQLIRGDVPWAIVNEWGGAVRLIDWRAGRELARFEDLEASAVAVCGSGTAAATIDHHGELQVHRFQQDASGKWSAHTLPFAGAPTGSLWSTVALSTDGRWIVAAGYQNPSGVFERVDQRYEFRRLVGPSGSTSHELVLNPAQPVAALAYLDRTLRLIDYETGSIIAETPLESHAAGMSFASDGRLLACGSLGGPASVFDGRTLKVVHQLQSEEVAWCTVFSLDDRFVAVGNRDGGIAIWEVATGRRKVQWKGHDSGVTELIFSDNESLISCDSRGNLRRWNIRAVGRELKRLGVTPNEIEL